ncbi:hypothetical protein OA57_02420 [Chelonobacter oris]|uniref:Uncharacterized protein n=1 Tax=Chelonobacter oris TaxID=505317 RepID=A0A0A3AVL2_9PAST|nr:TonB-dependent receptor [Chelonobacter oris]KGQ71105.1 hypothetical protein OA57_02420 [Chelonobacter oris]
MKYDRLAYLVKLACLSCSLSGLLSFNVAANESEQDDFVLDDLKVVGTARTAEQKTFSVAGAVSAIGENKQMQSLDSTVRALPGTFTNINPTQGTVSVNIRGMTGFGRVNTMIDDVPQTFYGTSSNSSSKYHSEDGGYGPSSQFGVMIDPNFLVGAEISRGFSQGAKGVNALNGHANLRTIGVDDVVFADNTIGLLAKYQQGSNGLGKNGMLALGAKTALFDSGSLGAMFAYSGGRSEANYKRGDGSFSAENDYVRRLDQSPRSWLGKIDFAPNADHKLEFGTRGYQNDVGGRKTQNKSYNLHYRFNPASPLYDVKFLAAYTDNRQFYHDDSNIWSLGEAKTRNESYYLNLSNTAQFHWRSFTSDLTLGTSLMRNVYTKRAVGVNQSNYDYTPFSPTGKQKIHSVYLTHDLNYHDFTLSGGLTYTHGTLSGHKEACGSLGGSEKPLEDFGCFPKNAADMKLVSKSLHPSVMLAWDLNDWFKPFVSYSQSTRMPNTQEVFFNNEGAGSMNPYLKPERSTIYQIGFNTEKENVFTENDFLGVKLTAYMARIKDFIYSQSFYMTNSGKRTTDLNNPDLFGSYHAQIYINAHNRIKQHGVELSIDYDAEVVFAKLAYSHQKTGTPLDVTSSTGTGFGTTTITHLPEDYATLTLGARLFDQKLTIGSIFKYTGKSQREVPQGLVVEEYGNRAQDLPKMPIVIDLYSTYQLNKHVLLKTSIQNVTDKNYIDALNSLNSTSSQHAVDRGDNYVYSFTNAARGRTFLLGAEIRF